MSCRKMSQSSCGSMDEDKGTLRKARRAIGRKVSTVSPALNTFVNSIAAFGKEELVHPHGEKARSCSPAVCRRQRASDLSVAAVEENKEPSYDEDQYDDLWETLEYEYKYESGHSYMTPETQKAKRSLAQYAKFIRNGIVERFKNPASRGSGVGEIVKVEVRQSESLERKVEDVCRSLRFYQDTVEKGILAMLPGSATIVLEMVLALTLALKPCFSNQLSSALTSVLGQVHQSVGELVRWSDQHMLYGDKACTSASVREVVEAVHKAVKELVDLAVDKENVNLSDSSLLDLPLSNTFPKKDVGFSKRISENGNASHRSSLPEITSLSPTDSEKTFITSTPDSGSTPAKLCHSLSSDSILNSQGEGGELVPPPKPPLPVVRHRPSFEGDIAPPLPPKKRGHPKGSSPVEDQSPPHGCGSPPGASPREGSTSPWCRRSTVSATSTVPDWSSSPLHHSGDLSPSSSQDSVTHEDLTQSSLDSSYSHNHSHLIDSFTFGHHSIGSDDFQTAFSKTFGPERLVMGYQFVDEPTLSPSYNSYSSSSSQHTSITQNSKSVSYSGETHFRSEAQSYSHKSQFVSRASQDDNHTVTLSVPPALPKKTRTPQQQVLMEVKKMECRTPSQYDNVPHDFNPADSEGYDEHISKHEGDPSPELPPKKSYSQYSSSSSCNSSFSSGYTSSSASSSTTNGSSSSVVQLRRHTCLVQQTQFSSSTVADVDTTPPPLPPKRKPVTDYIDVIKSEYNQPNANEFLRHSSLQLTYYQSQYNLHGKDFHGTDFYLHREGMHGTAHRMEMLALGDGLAPPALPPKQKTKQPAIEAPMEKLALTCQPVPQAITYPSLTPAITSSTLAVHNQCEEVKHEEEEEEEEEGPLDMLDVNDYLVLKKSGDDGPDIRGGPVDSLIVHASKANKNDFLYQEAFLTTYRTFISPGQLITKLLYRYNKFCKTSDPEKVKAGRNAFSLLVRVVDDLAITDLDIEILETLTQFVYNLLCHGDLLLARALRKKIVEKCESKQRYNAPKDNLTSLSISTRPATLLDFQAHEIAEQMTLLDAELFLKIEIPEVLIWAKEQNEETSPNLTQFTEHFNKMSYWARSRILEQEDARDREKYVARFIKIMKHLRKINNFNSYLAVLSALDSAPVRRLEWQRNITEGLKEYCALIDSSSSFRAYRQALAETTPPCIPYIGLILQDLTFVHIGNSDMINDDLVNFSKRWQQFNILDNMKRFKKCQYHFKKNDRIVAFFNSFINHLSEEALWDISEKIKPRKKKAVV